MDLTTPTFRVDAVREDGWWGLEADLGQRTVASQSRRLDDADPMIREAVAMVLDVAEDSFDIDLHPRLDFERTTWSTALPVPPLTAPG